MQALQTTEGKAYRLQNGYANESQKGYEKRGGTQRRTIMTPQQALEALERVRDKLEGIKCRNSAPVGNEVSAASWDDYQAACKALTELPAAISALKAMVGEVDSQELPVDKTIAIRAW